MEWVSLPSYLHCKGKYSFFTWKFAYRVAVLIGGAIIGITGPPREARQARLGPFLDFENQKVAATTMAALPAKNGGPV